MARLHLLTGDEPISVPDMRRVLTEYYAEACVKKATMHDLKDCMMAVISQRMDRMSLHEFLDYVLAMMPELVTLDKNTPCECDICKAVR